MLRSRNPDAENVAPGGLTSTQAPQKAAGNRKALDARKSNVGKTGPSTKDGRLSVRKPLAPRSGNEENLPSKNGAGGTAASKPRPKRRALGDITNRGVGDASSAEVPLQGKARTKENMRPVPRDKVGRVEEPDIFPEPLPLVYEPPVIDFTEEELALTRPEDDGCDPLGRPYRQRVYDFPVTEGDGPPPFETGEVEDDGFEGRLDQFVGADLEGAKWSIAETLSVDDFELMEMP